MIPSLHRHQWLLYALLFFCLLSCTQRDSESFAGGNIVGNISREDLIGPSRNLDAAPQAPVTSFIVIYEGDLTTMLTEEHSAFKYLVETYELQIDTPSSVDELDDAYKKITLYTTSRLDAPVDIGKKLSLVHEVLMVQVGEADAEEGLIQ